MVSRTASLALDDQLCFALYSASRAMTARYRTSLVALGLTYPQYLVMLVLWEEGAATVSRLGNRLRLDSGTLSPLLKRLESTGLISRHRGPEDERSVEIRLTAAGRRLRGRAAGIPVQMRRAVGPVDQAALASELRALDESLRNF